MPQLFNCIYGQRTQDWPSIAAGARATTTITVPGAALGDFVDVSMALNQSTVKFDAFVSAPNTVTVVATNFSGGAVDLASGLLRVCVQK